MHLGWSEKNINLANPNQVALLQEENVNLKVEIIIQQNVIQSHADQSESECTSYNCKKCDFEFDEEDALETHQELYHEYDNFSCDN